MRLNFYNTLIQVIVVCSKHKIEIRLQKKANFINEKNLVLLQEVSNGKSTLFTSFSSEVTNKVKTAVWEQIVLKVSALGLARLDMNFVCVRGTAPVV